MALKRARYPLHQSPFYRLSSKKRLASLLGITVGDISSLARGDELYSLFTIPKKTGGSRVVENPRRDLKLAQAKLARLLSRIAPRDYLFCPVKGRSYVTNAAAHVGHRVVRCLDVRKYFPNTPSRRVYWFFKSVMRCSADVAAVLARLSTYKGHLPTGSPASPILAFYAHLDVWENVAAIARAHDCVLTVYVDDVTISGNKVPSAVMWEVKKSIHRAGLRYHKEKTYVDRPAEITGVVVANDGLRLPNRQHQKLWQARKALEKDLPAPARCHIQGIVKGLEGQRSQILSFGRRVPQTKTR